MQHGTAACSRNGTIAEMASSHRILLVVLAAIVMILFGAYKFVVDESERSGDITAEESASNGPVHGYSVDELLSNMDKAFSCKYLSTAVASVEVAIQQIAEYWAIDQYPLFRTFMHIPPASWDIQKVKFVKLFLEAMANEQEYYVKSKTVSSASRAFESRKISFVAAFSGSSVTAGHDNFYNESFPEVFGAVLRPVFTSMGIELEVRNQALGNNPCFPYDACIETHVGADVDLLAWEQSMNCGHWVPPLEAFARSAYFMPKKPTLLFLASGSPYWPSSDCDSPGSNTTDLAIDEDLAALEKAIIHSSVRRGAELVPHLSHFSFLVDNVPGDNGTYQELLADRHIVMAPMAQSTLDCVKYKCHGPYSRKFSDKSIGGGAAHHPGRLGHKLRGDNLSYYLLSIALDALRTIRTSLSSRSQFCDYENSILLKDKSRDTKAAWNKLQMCDPRSWPKTVAAVSSTDDCPTPLPGECDALPSLTALHCYIDQYLLQLYAQHPLPALPAHFKLPELQIQPHCFTDYEPRRQRGLSDIIVRQYSNWQRDIAFLDKAAVMRSRNRGLGYKDVKYVYSSSGVNSTIAFLIRVNGLPRDAISSNGTSTSSSRTRLWIAELQKGFQNYPATHADLSDEDAVDTFLWLHYDKASPFNTTTTSFEKEPDYGRMLRIKLYRWHYECYRTAPVPSGLHLLTLRQRSTRILNVAYVVSW